jgi:hypothetical protein
VARAQVFGFEWGFLDEICRWALAFALFVGVVGGLVTRSLAFALSVFVVAGIDIALVAGASRRGRTELEAGRIDAVAPTVMLAGRLVVKAGLLVVWLFWGGMTAFAGAVAGALVFDVTLAFGGSALAIYRGMHHPHEVG